MEDRISQLPEDIQHHILSFLPLEQQVRLSVLSKTWKQAWTTYPVLEFSRDNCWGPDTGNLVLTCWWERERDRRREQLTDFVEQTLRGRMSQSINLSKLVLVLPEEVWNDPILVSRWIEYSVKSNVKHLQVYAESRKHKARATPKMIPVFLGKFMTVLDLSGSKLELRPPSDGKVRLCLKKLSLTCVSVDENSLQNLIHSCPDLEYFSIRGCPELKSLKFIGLLKLKTLILDITEKLEIKGLTNLECFSFLGGFGCSNQSPMMSISVSVCKNLTSLVLENAPCFTNYDWFGDLSCIFPLLNYLRLHHCHMSKSFKISGHCLVTVDIRGCDKLTHLHIDAPNLLCFRYSGLNPITFSSNAMALSQADIDLGRDGQPKCMDDSWYLQIAEFLGKFNHCKIVNFRSDYHVDVIIPKKLRKTLIPPLYNVKHLTFKIASMFMSHMEYVESLLWISPRLETLSISQYTYSNISFKFTYDESMEKGDDPCCTTIPIICWRHSLKEVKVMDNYRTRKFEQGDLKNYFHQNAKMLHKIDVSDTTN